MKYGAIKNLSSFLTVFDTEKKENLIDVFLQLQVIKTPFFSFIYMTFFLERPKEMENP